VVAEAAAAAAYEAERELTRLEEAAALHVAALAVQGGRA
jgi:hypothetical protein